MKKGCYPDAGGGIRMCPPCNEQSCNAPGWEQQREQVIEMVLSPPPFIDPERVYTVGVG